MTGTPGGHAFATSNDTRPSAISRENTMRPSSRWATLLVGLPLLTLLLATCAGVTGSESSLYVPDLTQNPAVYDGKEITVDGAYLWRPDLNGAAVLALGVSTLDNGLDAQPLGDAILVENFPAEATGSLHQPGDAVYGFVRVSGRFEATGGYGPDGSYKYRLAVATAEPIERVVRSDNAAPREVPEGVVSIYELAANPEKYNGQPITARGYYFWNSVIYVLAEGVSTEEDGTSPRPEGKSLWLEGFSPEESGKLNLGPNNSYVWGYVEVTGTFQTGGGFGKDGAYTSILNVTSSKALPKE